MRITSYSFQESMISIVNIFQIKPFLCLFSWKKFPCSKPNTHTFKKQSHNQLHIYQSNAQIWKTTHYSITNFLKWASIFLDDYPPPFQLHFKPTHKSNTNSNNKIEFGMWVLYQSSWFGMVSAVLEQKNGAVLERSVEETAESRGSPFFLCEFVSFVWAFFSVIHPRW